MIFILQRSTNRLKTPHWEIRNRADHVAKSNLISLMKKANSNSNFMLHFLKTIIFKMIRNFCFLNYSMDKSKTPFVCIWLHYLYKELIIIMNDAHFIILYELKRVLNILQVSIYFQWVFKNWWSVKEHELWILKT